MLSCNLVSTILFFNIISLTLAYPYYLRDAFSGRSWPKCSEINEVCSTDLDCCEKRPCKPTYLPFGPKSACSSRSRSSRHLIGLPEAPISIPSNKLLLGEKCVSSKECGEEMCCQVIYLFRMGEKNICDIKTKYSDCI